MTRIACLLLGLIIITTTAPDTSASPRTVIPLNGEWAFEQTESARQPEEFSRRIPVPGLVDLAKPKLADYDLYFEGDHPLRYNWYSRSFKMDGELSGRIGTLTLRKSQYGTRAFVNGQDVGYSQACQTPILFDITRAMKPGANELVICVDERPRVEPRAATGWDPEKRHEIPGIWDDVYVTLTDSVRIDDVLVLPDLAHGKATVKVRVHNHHMRINRSNRRYEETPVTVRVKISEAGSGETVSEEAIATARVRCQRRGVITVEVPLGEPHPWSPDDPFLYRATVTVETDRKVRDEVKTRFGLRDFGAVGRRFELNGKGIMLHGSNICLYRFLEDPDRGALPWDRDWVERVFINIPKKLGWNSFRVCIGLLPDFWYDLADEHGLLLQNEYPMWKTRGWDDQIEREYTDWVWADGSHPSVAIWDAMNEDVDDFIGNELLPELRLLDPTRIWDAGYMDEANMSLNEIDEPHYYPMIVRQPSGYALGRLTLPYQRGMSLADRPAPQVLNEYNWLWLDRDGVPSILSKEVYEYFIGDRATDPQACWELQGYLLQLQTEEIRAHRDCAGIMSFCYLSNTKGYTGDWFTGDIKDLEPSPALIWQYHCFAPFAVFPDLADGRYVKETEQSSPGSEIDIPLIGLNDTDREITGKVRVELVDIRGKRVAAEEAQLTIAPHWQANRSLRLTLPAEPGNYVLLVKTEADAPNLKAAVSRRYMKIGDSKSKDWPEIDLKGITPF